MITYSVGRGCVNKSPDIKMVQELLIRNGYGEAKTEGLITVPTAAGKAVAAAVGAAASKSVAAAVKVVPVKATGDLDAVTQDAIDDFQAGFMDKPNGCVEPKGTTIQKLWPIEYANPTGGGIRPYKGEAGADSAAYWSFAGHNATDWLSTETQKVFAYMSGVVDWPSYPYFCPDYKYGPAKCQDLATLCGLAQSGYCYLDGILITASDGSTCKMFYFVPTVPQQSIVRAGDVVGTAQSLKTKYGESMPNHIHVQVWRNGVQDPSKLINT